MKTPKITFAHIYWRYVKYVRSAVAALLSSHAERFCSTNSLGKLVNLSSVRRNEQYWNIQRKTSDRLEKRTWQHWCYAILLTTHSFYLIFHVTIKQILIKTVQELMVLKVLYRHTGISLGMLEGFHESLHHIISRNMRWQQPFTRWMQKPLSTPELHLQPPQRNKARPLVHSWCSFLMEMTPLCADEHMHTQTHTLQWEQVKTVLQKGKADQWQRSCTLLGETTN